MLIECIDNSGFEDLLSCGTHYPVLGLGGQSVQLRDNSGQVRWFGRGKFAQPCLQASTLNDIAEVA